jgi:hypothetical protein
MTAGAYTVTLSASSSADDGKGVAYSVLTQVQ